MTSLFMLERRQFIEERQCLFLYVRCPFFYFGFADLSDQIGPIEKLLNIQ